MHQAVVIAPKVVDGESRICRNCARKRPIARFRLRSRNGSNRMHECDACHRESERQRRANRRTERNRREIDMFANQSRHVRNSNQLAALCDEVLGHFGGVAGLSDEFFQAFCYVREHDRGGRRMLDYLRLAIKLIEHSDEQSIETDYGDLSVEELEEQMMLTAMEGLKRNPRLAIEALERLGCRVTPPSQPAIEDSSSGVC